MSAQASGKRFAASSRILRTFVPRCRKAVKTELAPRSTVLGASLVSVQADSHFRISDSLGTLPATLTSPSTTRAGVMKTPY
jgi:hypothetical protein